MNSRTSTVRHPSRNRDHSRVPIAATGHDVAVELSRGVHANGARRRVLMRTAAMTLDALIAGGLGLAIQPGRLAPALVAALATVVCVMASGGYRFGDRMTSDLVTDCGRLALAALCTGWFVAMSAAVVEAHQSASAAFAFVPALAAGLIGVRFAFRVLGPPPVERVVVIGSGRWARRIADLAGRHHERRFEVIGCLDDDPAEHAVGDPPLIGRLSRLTALLSRGEVDRIVVAGGAAEDHEVVRVLRECEPFGIPVDVLPRFFELIGHQSRTYRIGGTPMLTLKRRESTVGQRRAKRAFDLCVAGSLVLLSAIPCLVVAALIKLGDRGPVFFRQRRIGRDGQPFEVLKFRTMVPDADALGDIRIAGLKEGTMSMAAAVTELKQAEDPRITWIGGFLRASSIDELPQILNVLRGEMSLVGPRPLRDFEVDSLAGWERDRQQMQPGLTGLWQVSGRSGVGWEERLGMDYLYVRHWSLAGDARILCATVPALFGRRGAQ